MTPDESDREALRDARRALARLRRALEKSRRELDSAADAVRRGGGADQVADALYVELSQRLGAAGERVEEEAERLRALLLDIGITVHPGSEDR